MKHKHSSYILFALQFFFALSLPKSFKAYRLNWTPNTNCFTMCVCVGVCANLLKFDNSFQWRDRMSERFWFAFIWFFGWTLFNCHERMQMHAHCMLTAHNCTHFCLMNNFICGSPWKLDWLPLNLQNGKLCLKINQTHAGCICVWLPWKGWWKVSFCGIYFGIRLHPHISFPPNVWMLDFNSI